jgi:integral membrane sensor domain MASE1
MVSASIGVAVLFATHVHPWSNVDTAWLMYWLGDSMGVLLVAPLALTFPTLWKISSRLRIAELTALVLLLSVACLFIFTDRTLFALKLNVLGFAVFPFVIWAAHQRQPVGLARLHEIFRFSVPLCCNSILPCLPSQA